MDCNQRQRRNQTPESGQNLHSSILPAYIYEPLAAFRLIRIRHGGRVCRQPTLTYTLSKR